MIRQTSFCIILIILLFYSFFFYLLLVYATTSEIQHKYEIELPEIETVIENKSCITDSCNHYITIYAKVIDHYGKDVNGTLNYSLDRSSHWTNSPMKLINGIPSNGTFLGIIPVTNQNSLGNYKLYFKDELGYTNSPEEEEGEVAEFSLNLSRLSSNFLNLVDKKPPRVSELNYGYNEPDKPIFIRSHVEDSDSGVQNVTLYYDANYTEYSNNLFKRFSSPMNLIDGDKKSGTYQGVVRLSEKGLFYPPTYEKFLGGDLMRKTLLVFML